MNHDISRALLVIDMQNGFCHPDGSMPRIGMPGGRAGGGGQRGRRGASVVAELGGRPEDLLVDKVRFDAFQWTSLEPLLRGLSVDDLVVCGVVTNLCVETTVRSAFMRDYSVTLLADCCAAKTRRLHELSLEVLASYQLAAIAAVGDGFEVGRPPAPATQAG